MKRILFVLASLCVAAVVLLAREVRRAPEPVHEHAARAVPLPRASVRVVVPAGVAPPPETQLIEGAPELPAPTVPTLATMPASAPAHPETMVPPNPTAPVATGS